MKKQLVLSLAFCLLFFFTKAQLDKKTWLVGGNFSFSASTNSSTNHVRTNLFQIAPNVGYFLWDKLVAGIKLDITLQRDGYPTSTTTLHVNNNHFLYGLFTRYYLLNKEKQVNVLVEGNYAFGSNKASGYYPISDAKINKYSFFAGPVIYLNSNVGVEMVVGYFNYRDTKAEATTSGFQTNIGLQIHLMK
ncbi:hypothetical protein [Hydrobacter penzbergensis]|nr:hypothetical protein [Hydrobacter penzbergensis]